MQIHFQGLDLLPEREKVRKILDSALEAAEPAAAVERIVRRDGDHIIIGDDSIDVSGGTRVYVIGVGKASIRMAEGLANALGDLLHSGVIITKHSNKCSGLPKNIQILTGSHPVPDETSVSSTKSLVDFLKSLTGNDIVFCLISGGGSSLMAYPAEGIDLSDIQEMTRQLLACGADIGEINTLRKHLDTVKGGGLTRISQARLMVTLILSDVIGSPLDVIASGPTVADRSTFRDAMEIIGKYALEPRIPRNIIKYLKDGIDHLVPETVKENDPCLLRVRNILIGSNPISAMAALEAARRNGFTGHILTTSLHGEANQAGMFLGGILHEIANNNEPFSRPVCLIAGGETTVTLRGNGLGGRNLELALGAVAELKGLENTALITLATDGEDGPSGAAGAVVTGDTYRIGAAKGILPDTYLKNNDSYHYFEKAGGLLVTGSTGTNVNDLCFLFAF